MVSNNEYMREYMKRRYHRRRAYWIVRLGGVCVRCDSVEDLQFDHKDRTQKKFDVGKAFAGWSDTRLEAELSKCQLLCCSCHKRKTQELGDHGKGTAEHGTYWMYRKYKCRCESCVVANSAQLKKWKQKRAADAIGSVADS